MQNNNITLHVYNMHQILLPIVVTTLLHNQISVIPNGIDIISAVEINLSQNQISVIPESVAKCKQLKVRRTVSI